MKRWRAGFLRRFPKPRFLTRLAVHAWPAKCEELDNILSRLESVEKNNNAVSNNNNASNTIVKKIATADCDEDDELFKSGVRITIKTDKKRKHSIDNIMFE